MIQRAQLDGARALRWRVPKFKRSFAFVFWTSGRGRESAGRRRAATWDEFESEGTGAVAATKRLSARARMSADVVHHMAY